MSRRPAWWLKVSVRVKSPGHGFRLPLAPMALYVFYFAMLGFDGLVSMLPRKIKAKAQLALYTLEQGILAVAGAGPQEFVNIEINSKNSEVRVRVRTC